MDSKIYQKILLNHNNLIEKVAKFEKKRFLYYQINQTKGILIGIKGLRGIGKTVLMLQIANEKQNSIYFSADSYYLKDLDLFDIIENLIERGHEWIFIDEIHKKENYSEVLKTVYDQGFTKIYFSGSSSLNILQGTSDLSRRAIIYDLPIASFREYLVIKKGMDIEPITLSVILSEKNELIKKIGKYAVYLQEYYERGGILYDTNELQKTLMNSISKIIYEDLTAGRQINSFTQNSAFMILWTLAKSKPGDISFNKLANLIGSSVQFVKSLIFDLESTGLIVSVESSKASFRKTKKLFLPFPLRYAICSEIAENFDTGTIREEFFVNHLKPNSNIYYLKTDKTMKTPDFLVGDLTFEIGGSGKKNSQKANYRVVDYVTIEENKIPLHFFGFIY
jgi:uncharacterized protein